MKMVNQTDINTNEIDENLLVSQFRDFCGKHKKTSKYEFNDTILLKFLRSRGYDFKESHKVLSNMLTIMKDHPELFSWRDQLVDIVKCGIYVHYPIKNSDGSRIILMRPSLWDTKKYSITDVITAGCFLTEISLQDEQTQRIGCSLIVDQRNLGMSHAFSTGLKNIRILAHLGNSCVPIKVNCIHVLHVNRLAVKVYDIIKPLLTEECNKKLCFYGDNLDVFYQKFPKSHVTPHFGGTAQEFSPEYYSDLLLKHKDDVLAKWQMLKDCAVKI